MAKPRSSQKRNRRAAGSRRYADYSQEMLQIAAENVRLGKMSSYEAQKMFNIPRRTIFNKARNKHTRVPGGQVKLKPEEEKQFVNVLIAAADFGNPLTELDLRIVVYEYLKNNNKQDLFHNKMPGRWWVKFFLERYKSDLTTRVTQNIKRVRAEKNETEFEEYFQNLEKSLKDIPHSNILNFDETNFSDNPGNAKCIFKRTVKYPERIMNFTKDSISVMFAATANGDCLAPYTVYKAEKMWELWRLNGPRGSRYNSTKSGWFDSVTFQDWFETIILPWAQNLPGDKVIIGDNLSSHVNVEIFKLCQENNIRFVFLPPNATHLAQPLDVSFFGPLKKQWRKILTQYKIDFPQNSALNKADFPKLLKALMESLQLSKKENIMSGFRTTGIVPINPTKVLKKLPTYEDEIKYNVDETLLNYLKAQRDPKATEKRKRNQKIAIAPGKSVEAKDIEEIEQQKTIKKNKFQKNTVGAKSDCLDSLSMPSTSKNENQTLEPAEKMIITQENTSDTSHKEILHSKKKINVIQEEFLNKNKLKAIMKNVDVKKMKHRQVICKRIYSDDSDTDVTDKISLHESEDSLIEDFGIEEDTEDMDIDETYLDKTETAKENENEEEIRIGTFLMVKFITKKSTKFYIGEVIRLEEDGVTVKFLRKKTNNLFVWPIKDDIGFVLYGDIETILRPPQLLRRGVYKFTFGVNKLNIC